MILWETKVVTSLEVAMEDRHTATDKEAWSFSHRDLSFELRYCSTRTSYSESAPDNICSN